LKITPVIKTKLKPIIIEKEKLEIKPILSMREATKQIQKQLQKQQYAFFGFIPAITPAVAPVITSGPGIIPPIMFPAEVEFLKGKRIGYETHVKSKGKYKKVSDKPMTKSAAQDLGARIVDNTVSAMFKIEPITQTKTVKGKKKKVPKPFGERELQRGDNYFKRTMGKFRNYMIRKGRRIEMQNKWIEKKTKRIDTRGEAQGLTVAQFQARARKKARGLPVRRTKRKGVNQLFGL